NVTAAAAATPTADTAEAGSAPAVPDLTTAAQSQTVAEAPKDETTTAGSGEAPTADDGDSKTKIDNPLVQHFEMPEFPKNLQWLNSRPLTKADLKGKFVLIDFWTYCCINCMHILPELKKLEQQFPKNLIVIGVHSAKFETEKEVENIREAILRYE